MSTSIVCGIDASADSQAALSFADQLARRLGSRLVLAHFTEPVPVPYTDAPFWGARGGERVAIASVGGTFYAFGDTCTHQGCSLADGELEGTTVTCPCHGSQFDVTTGDVLRGPAREPVRSYPVRLEDGELRV